MKPKVVDDVNQLRIKHLEQEVKQLRYCIASIIESVGGQVTIPLHVLEMMPNSIALIETRDPANGTYTYRTMKHFVLEVECR